MGGHRPHDCGAEEEIFALDMAACWLDEIPKFENFYAAAFVKWPLHSKTLTIKKKFIRWIANKSISAVEGISDFMGSKDWPSAHLRKGF